MIPLQIKTNNKTIGLNDGIRVNYHREKEKYIDKTKLNPSWYKRKRIKK